MCAMAGLSNNLGLEVARRVAALDGLGSSSCSLFTSGWARSWWSSHGSRHAHRRHAPAGKWVQGSSARRPGRGSAAYSLTVRGLAFSLQRAAQRRDGLLNGEARCSGSARRAGFIGSVDFAQVWLPPPSLSHPGPLLSVHVLNVHGCMLLSRAECTRRLGGSRRR